MLIILKRVGCGEKDCMSFTYWSAFRKYASLYITIMVRYGNGKIAMLQCLYCSAESVLNRKL